MKTLKKLREVIKEHGKKICEMAVNVATVSQSSCHYMMYEPEQPDGLKEFMNNHAKEG